MVKFEEDDRVSPLIEGSVCRAWCRLDVAHSIYLRLLLLWARREGDWVRRDLGLVTRPSLVAGILDGLICLVGGRLDETNSLVSMVDRNRREEEWNATSRSASGDAPVPAHSGATTALVALLPPQT